MARASSTRTSPALASLFVALAILIVAALMLSTRDSGIAPAEVAPPSLGERIRVGDVPPPPLTEEIRASLETFPHFDALVSYTDTGFEPPRLTVHPGAVVRFVNNSSRPFWIAADGENHRLYPSTGPGCGSSDIDSCGPIEPLGQWTFRFEEAGEWHVEDNLRKSSDITILVR